MCVGQYLSAKFSLLYFRYCLNIKFQKHSEILYFKFRIFYKYFILIPFVCCFLSRKPIHYEKLLGSSV